MGKTIKFVKLFTYDTFCQDKIVIKMMLYFSLDFANQVEYSPKLANSPDLPSWLFYTYDGYNSVGYLYGVPPPHLSSVNLEVIGWNRGDNYDVRKLIISMEIVRKETALKHVVELKVDNFNIKDMASPRRMGELVNILKNQLSWGNGEEREDTVVPVFMASAVALGENRVPVKPNEAEGYAICVFFVHKSSTNQLYSHFLYLELLSILDQTWILVRNSRSFR